MSSNATHWIWNLSAPDFLREVIYSGLLERRDPGRTYATPKVRNYKSLQCACGVAITGKSPTGLCMRCAQFKRRKTEGPSKRQRQILAIIRERYAEGLTTKPADLMEPLGICYTTARTHCIAMRRKGLLFWGYGPMLLQAIPEAA